MGLGSWAHASPARNLKSTEGPKRYEMVGGQLLLIFFSFFFHLKTKHSLRVKYVRAITTNTRNIKTVAHPRCAVNASLLLGTRAVVGCLAVVLPHAGVPEIAGCAYWSDDGVRTEGGVASTVACCTL